MSYRHSLGFPYVYPDNELGFAENFMNMLWKMVEPKYVADASAGTGARYSVHPPCGSRAELQRQCDARGRQCVHRSVLTTAAAAAALSGPLHGGANEEVLKMLDEIGSKANVPAYIKKIKEGHGKLMGFGHRVYKNYDPRAKVIKWTAEQVFEVTGRNPKLDIALELERIALAGRLLRSAETLPERGLLLWNHLPSYGLQAGDVYGLVRHSPHSGMACPVAGNADRSRPEDSRPRQIWTGLEVREFVPLTRRVVPATTS